MRVAFCAAQVIYGQMPQNGLKQLQLDLAERFALDEQPPGRWYDDGQLQGTELCDE